jgi:HD domain
MQACLAFWGKTGFQLDGQAGAKPVLHHLLDVASVAKALLETRPQLSSRLARMLGIAPGEVAPPDFLLRRAA